MGLTLNISRLCRLYVYMYRPLIVALGLRMDLRGYGCCPPKHTDIRTQNQTVYRATQSYVTTCVYHKGQDSTGQDRTGQDVLRQMIIILHASIDRLCIGSRLLHLGVTCNGDASLGSIHIDCIPRYCTNVYIHLHMFHG